MASRSFPLGLAAFLLVSPGSGCFVDDLPERGEPIPPSDEDMDEDEDDEPLCIEHCDPLEPMCSLNETCLPADPGFHCVGVPATVEGTRRGLHDTCEVGSQTCNPGLICMQLPAPGCNDGRGCCLAFCDRNHPECPDGTTCHPIFEAAAMCYEEVGICILA